MDMSLSSSSLSSKGDDRLLEIDQALEQRGIFWLNFLKYYLKHNLTFECLEDTARLFNSMPNNPIEIPETKYKIMKEFSAEKTPFKTFVYCVQCKTYMDTDFGRSKICSTCTTQLKTSETNFFVSFNVSVQLQKILQHFWGDIIQFQNTVNEESICDIIDGKIIKELIQENPTNLKLTLLVNTDGVQVSKSGKKSLWPIQAICTFLPPNIRYNRTNIILTGVYLDVKKPDIMSFFQPLAEEFAKINEEGIELVIDGERKTVNVHITHCSLDLPAQSLVQGINLYSGYSSCTFCLHGGVSVLSKTKQNSYVRYIWGGVLERPRTHETTLLDMENLRLGQVSKFMFHKSV